MTGTVKLALGVAVGLLAGGGGYLVAANTVEPEIVSETVTETVTETETVVVTPDACVDALGAAQAVHLLLIDNWTSALGVTSAQTPENLIGELESLPDTDDLDEATELWWETYDKCMAAAR